MPADLKKLLTTRFCDWITFTKIKRGPKACHFCRACQRFSREMTCPLDALIAQEGEG